MTPTTKSEDELHRFKGTFPNKAACTSDATVWGSPSHRHFWATGKDAGNSHYSLRFNRPLEQLTELRKALYLRLLFYCKGYELGPGKWRRAQSKAGEGDKCSVSMSSPYGIKTPTPWHIEVFPSQEAHLSLLFRISIGVLLLMHDWLNYWSRDVTELILQPLFIPRGWVSSNPLIPGLLFPYKVIMSTKTQVCSVSQTGLTKTTL